METLVNLTWRVYLVVPFMALGAVLVARGMQRGGAGLRRAVRGDAAQLVPFVEGFRVTIWGLALIGVAAAWLWQLTWLLVIALAVGVGETMETTLILFALHRGAHLSIGAPRLCDPQPAS